MLPFELYLEKWYTCESRFARKKQIDDSTCNADQLVLEVHYKMAFISKVYQFQSRKVIGSILGPISRKV